jgi:hypothetical protein
MVYILLLCRELVIVDLQCRHGVAIIDGENTRRSIFSWC